MTNTITGISSGQAPEHRTRVLKENRAPGDSQSSTGDGEAVVISEDANKIINLESKLKDISDIDEAKVEAIRSQIQQGNYHIDPRRIAQKFLEIEAQL